MSKSVTVRVGDDLLAWADAYAGKQGVSRTTLLENALSSFKDDCERGVPELKARIASRPKDGPGTCLCPVFDDGQRGFAQKCSVHGGRSREDFARLTAERAEMFSHLAIPDSVRGVKRARKLDNEKEA